MEQPVAVSDIVADLLRDLLVGEELGVEVGEMAFGALAVFAGVAKDGGGWGHDEGSGHGEGLAGERRAKDGGACGRIRSIFFDFFTGLLWRRGPTIAAVETTQRIQGREVTAAQLDWLRGWIAANPSWSRKRLAKELCAQWDWRDNAGRAKDFAARSFLLKLSALGVIELPALRPRSRTGFRRKEWAPEGWQEPAAIESALGTLLPLDLAVIEAGSAAERQWGFYLARYHYLGLKVVGENLGYLVRDRTGREVACLLFGAAAWRCAARDQFLEWGTAERAAGLSGITNNTRFLILPWVKVPHLASHILGAAARRIDADWRAKYGHGLTWLETFVERERFRGTCYRAANWVCVGQTKGRSRQDRYTQLKVPVKDVWIYRVR